LKASEDQLSTLFSPLLHWFIVAMALGLLVTMVLGIIMAFRFGRRQRAVLCLAGGVVVPLVLVLLATR
jgi:hypothetical protein